MRNHADIGIQYEKAMQAVAEIRRDAGQSLRQTPASQQAALEGSLSYSSGEFVTAIKQQLEKETKLAAATAGLFEEIAGLIQSAATDIKQMDENYSRMNQLAKELGIAQKSPFEGMDIKVYQGKGAVK